MLKTKEGLYSLACTNPMTPIQGSEYQQLPEGYLQKGLPYLP